MPRKRKTDVDRVFPRPAKPTPGRTQRYFLDLRGKEFGNLGREPIVDPDSGSNLATTDYTRAVVLGLQRLQDVREAVRKGLDVPRPNRPAPARGDAVDRRLAAVALWYQDLVDGMVRRRERDAKWARTQMTYLSRLLDAPTLRASMALDDVTVQLATATVDWLKEQVSRFGTPLSPSAVRAHVFLMSDLFIQAGVRGRVTAGYNPWAKLTNLPGTPAGRDVEWHEPWEAALMLEAARQYRPVTKKPGRETPYPYPLMATYYLTGGRAAEVLRLQMRDVSDDDSRRVMLPGTKNETSRRLVQPWPQLIEITGPYLRARRQELMKAARLLGLTPGELRDAVDHALAFPTPVRGAYKGKDEAGERLILPPLAVAWTPELRAMFDVLEAQTYQLGYPVREAYTAIREALGERRPIREDPMHPQPMDRKRIRLGQLRGVRRLMGRLATIAGFAPARVKRMGPKLCRHTYASLRALTVDESGRQVPREVVAAELGHGSTRMLDRVYQHLPTRPRLRSEVRYDLDLEAGSRELWEERLANIPRIIAQLRAEARAKSAADARKAGQASGVARRRRRGDITALPSVSEPGATS